MTNELEQKCIVMYYEDNHIKLYNKDCRQMLELEAQSVQCVVTSPPYWGLRKYSGEQELIWGGDKNCQHQWGQAIEIGDNRYRGENAIVGSQHNAAVWGGGKMMSQFCSLCGAWKGAYGLEPTPEMYIEHTIEILREIRRVLRKDGVVFWNIGDSYQGGNRGASAESDIRRGDQGGSFQPHNIGAKGIVSPSRLSHPMIKPKDLCLIPFRVAQEVQKPYYTGRIKDETDRIWLASMIDGEGCLFIHKRKVGQSNGQGYKRKHDSYGAGLEVANTHLSIINRCRDITGIGSICRVERETKTKKRNIPLYRWNVRSNECRNIIKEVYPYLVGKQHEARLLLGCPSSGEDAQKAHVSLIALHNGKEATIDFKPPESMYETGWYVRSVIIWSKNNPMPESVTDRPTESHEYILLLTKSAKYYWDADAVREPNLPQTLERYRHKDSLGLPRVWTEDGGNGIPISGGKEVNFNISPLGRNIRSVWEFPTQPFPAAHFAVFPEKLPELCIKAATPEVGCCSKCGAPWTRIIKHHRPSDYDPSAVDEQYAKEARKSSGHDGTNRPLSTIFKDTLGSRIETLGWQPTCKCNADKVPSVILDPFLGAGTVAWVAKKLNRQAVGYEISEEYCQLAVDRCRQQVLL